MEVLLSDNASSDSFYASQEYDKALQGARTSRTETGVISSVRHAEAVALRDLPYFPLVHLNATEIGRRDTWHGWLPSPAPSGRPLFEASQQILALRPGPEPVAAGTTAPGGFEQQRDGWLTTPRSVLIGAVLIALAILGSRFIGSSQRRTEPLEWTEE